MRNIIITGCLSAATFIAGIAFEVSGYENIYLAYGLWGLAAVLAIASFCLWLIPKLRQRRKKVKYGKIFEIEVPDEILPKVIGKPLPKGKTFTPKGKWVKTKIPKEKDNEL